jgi:hypothetical protein
MSAPFFFSLIFTTSSPNAKWSTRLVSWLFRLFTRSPVSHVAGIFNVGGIRMAIGAEPDGVTCIPLNKFLETNMIVYRICPVSSKIDLDRLESAYEKLLVDFGDSKYDYPAVGIGFLKYVFSLPVKWLEKFLSKKKVSCTELYIRYLEYAGFKCVDGLSRETTSAYDLLSACLESGEFTSTSYSKGDF